MLSGNCFEWSICRAYIPCPTVTMVTWCHSVMSTVHKHRKVVAEIAHKKIIDWKIDKYTYFRGEFWTQSKIHDRQFLRKLSTAKSFYFCKKAPPQLFSWALNTLYFLWLTYQKREVSEKATNNKKRCVNKKQIYLVNKAYLSN